MTWWMLLENFSLTKFFILILIAGVAHATPRFDNDLNKDALPLSIERHKRLFIAAGTPDTKLQLSFKIPLILNEKLYLGYTQTDFWKLYQKASSPFEDINHNPEVFYRWNLDDTSIFDLGMEHVSNGRDDVESRSWNAFYIQALKRWDKNFYISGKAYQLYDIDATNEDISRFIGTFEIEGGITDVIRTKFQNNELFVRWRPGSRTFDPSFTTIEAGLKVKFSSYRMFQHLFISYYNGYAESLLGYNKYTRAFRVGLIF